MAYLNYHHLRLFRAIAHAGTLSAAARTLNIAPSALSVQLRALEDQLGHALFTRAQKRLALTEAGRITLARAEEIFAAGDALVNVLAGRGDPAAQVLRIGALPTLSRNFQAEFLSPLLARPQVRLVLRSGPLGELVAALAAHALDLVLSNVAVLGDAAAPIAGPGGLHAHLLARQAVSLVGPKTKRRRRFRFPDDLDGARLILPGPGSELRAAFARALDLAGVRPIITAEVDDMAMLRLLARESGAIALVPPVVVRDELAAGHLAELCQVPGVSESFYALAMPRQFENPLARELLDQAERRKTRVKP